MRSLNVSNDYVPFHPVFPCKVYISICRDSHSTLIAILFKFMSIFIQIIYNSIFKLPHQCHLHLNHPFHFSPCFWQHIFVYIQINFINEEEKISGGGRDNYNFIFVVGFKLGGVSFTFCKENMSTSI